MPIDGRLRLFETWGSNGCMLETYLQVVDGVIQFEEPQQVTEMPLAVLESVFRRYGRPLEPELTVMGPTLQLSNTAQIVHFRYLARFDVIAKDYLVLVCDGQEPLAELATGIVAALSHIANAHH